MPKPSAEDDAMATSVGLRRGRELYQLRRPLPLEAERALLAEKAPVRAFVPGQDEDAWLALNNRAFGGHPEQGSWDRRTILAREEQPWFDPDGFLLSEQGGRLVAFCWTKIADPEEPGPGEIYVLGVDPALHGNGLGHAMLAAGCLHLERRGCPSAFLYVDAANTAALALYRGFGFRLDHHDRAYVADVPAATP
jgi:mycothiol synthase